MSPELTPLLSVKNLARHFTSGLFHKVRVKAVDGVSFTLHKGETLAIIGASGSGKTTLGRLVVRLLEPTAGQVHFKGKDLARLNGDLRGLRRSMQIIFQDADGSLNPHMRVKSLLLEPRSINGLNTLNCTDLLEELLNMVNLTSDLLNRYPHELSGGQRQRVGIARAMSLNPELIVADEPAASLDPSIQAHLLALMCQIQRDRGVSYLFISHDLRAVRMMAHRLAVMYRGRFVEYGNAHRIFSNPRHPYTRSLFAASPIRHRTEGAGFERLWIEEEKSSHHYAGCMFSQRCPYAGIICRDAVPEEKSVEEDHRVWCHFV